MMLGRWSSGVSRSLAPRWDIRGHGCYCGGIYFSMYYIEFIAKKYRLQARICILGFGDEHVMDQCKWSMSLIIIVRLNRELRCTGDIYPMNMEIGYCSYNNSYRNQQKIF